MSVSTSAIRNRVGWDPERLRRGASIGLGRALLQRLTGGIGWKVLSVNTHRPLFWFVGNADVASMPDLRGRRVAVHPAQTAPGWFTRIVLREHGLDHDRDLECVARFRVTTRWTCDAFGTARSTPPVSAPRSPPNRSPKKKGFTCWPGSAITFRFPP